MIQRLHVTMLVNLGLAVNIPKHSPNHFYDSVNCNEESGIGASDWPGTGLNSVRPHLTGIF